jgi:hypothetical protein
MIELYTYVSIQVPRFLIPTYIIFLASNSSILHETMRGHDGEKIGVSNQRAHRVKKSTKAILQENL